MQALFSAVPEELLNDPDYLQLFLPAVRADVEMLMTYNFKDEPPLDCPITSFGGDADPWVGRDGIEAWQVHTSGNFRSHILPGDHFYINTARRRIMEVITRQLATTHPAPSSGAGQGES